MNTNTNTKTATAPKENANGVAIFKALLANTGKTLAFAEIANLAGVEPKTGYLTAAKKYAKTKGFTIRKIENGVTVKIETVTTFPNGYKATAEKEATVTGYTLEADAKAEAKDAD